LRNNAQGRVLNDHRPWLSTAVPTVPEEGILTAPKEGQVAFRFLIPPGSCSIPLAAAGALVLVLPSAGSISAPAGLHALLLTIPVPLHLSITRTTAAAHGAVDAGCTCTPLHPTGAHCTSSHPTAHAHSAAPHSALRNAGQSQQRNKQAGNYQKSVHYCFSFDSCWCT